MRIRTNLHLDDNALEIASLYAHARGITLGIAVSELILHSERPSASNPSPKLMRDKHGLLIVRKNGSKITSKKTREESEDEFD